MIQELVFILIVSITLLAALLAVSLKKIFYNILSLVVALLGLACLFIYLNSEFMAVMQLVIYVGGISVAIIFAIMLSVPPTQTLWKREPKKLLKAIAISLLLFVGLVRLFGSTLWPESAIQVDDYSIRHLGELILGQYPFAFEVISLILLVAILGAILIARDDRGVQ